MRGGRVWRLGRQHDRGTGVRAPACAREQRMGVVRIEPGGRAVQQEDRRRTGCVEQRDRLLGTVGQAAGLGPAREPTWTALHPVDEDPAGVGHEVAREQVEDGPGPRAVGTAEREQLARVADNETRRTRDRPHRRMLTSRASSAITATSGSSLVR